MEPLPEQLFDIAVPDPSHTLGGVKDGDEPEHPSVLMHMVKQLMPGQDLTRVTIPAFFLEARSLLERMADTQMHPDLLLNVSTLPTPVERITAITKWFLSGWHYRTVGVKKPFNPIIGETFACYWKHQDGSRSQYFAEQVLHRPPISAIYFENRAHNMVASAHVWTKSQFSAPQTVKSILDGACMLTLTNLQEQYWITFPTYYAHNLLLGTLRMEVGDTAHIVCSSTGLRTDIDFHQKSMFGGADRLNSLSAVIRRTKSIPAAGAAAAAVAAAAAPGADLFHISGHWDSVMHISPVVNGKDGAKSVFLDINETPVSPKYVLPLNQQGPWESRRLWSHTADELNARPTVDWAAVDKEKAQLEEEQRVLACHAHKEKSPAFVEWATKKFHKKPVVDPLKGVTHEYFVFDDINTAPYSEGEPEPNLLALSRSLPDSRGGLKGSGADADIVAKTKSIAISSKRTASAEKF